MTTVRLYHKRKDIQRAGAVLCLLALGFLLAACGKKPGYVLPPPGAEAKAFPQVYPDPALDPKPENPQ